MKYKIICEFSVLVLLMVFILHGCKRDDFLTGQNTSAPEAPILLYPPNDTIIFSDTVTFNWMASTGAESYSLQISKSNTFLMPEYNLSGITNTIKQVSGLEDSIQYFWRVRAANNYGISPWSDSVRSFALYGKKGTGNPCPGIATVTYAGKTYNTVLIGTQCWLKENLDVGTMLFIGHNPANNGTIEKFCYYDLPENCVAYGGLYKWDEAMNYMATEKSRGICPPGWHIPAYAEIQKLADAVGGDGNALKAIGEGTGPDAGTNKSGFSALLSGYTTPEGYFFYLNIKGFFWSSTMYSAANIYYMDLYYNGSRVYFSNSSKEYGFSIRCIKDQDEIIPEIINLNKFLAEKPD